ncbi:protein-tyrosine phosphatase-like protein [Aspergillus cavernicola]|uniref:Protein-tyrosine phosphatase-like protein n=1 Tax=Aspergillus cavernicola TaxID=176166 RepID=A0ABR4HCC9_9EURO
MPTSIRVDGLFNLRDLGGYRSNLFPNARIRHGIIYRSGHLANITDFACDRLHELGVSLIINLTTPGETELFSGVVVLPDIPSWAHHLRAPYKNTVLSIADQVEKYKHVRTAGPTGVAQAYFKMLKSRPDVFQEILTRMIVYRTGVVCALLLSLGGVSDDVVADDYSFSEQNLQHMLPRMVELTLEVDPGVEDVEGLARVVTECRKDTMLITLEIVRMEYGGVYEYVKDCCNVSQGDIERIRRALLTEI